MTPQFVLHEEEFDALMMACGDLLRDACAKAVILIDKNGQLLAASGDTSELDATSLASLTAGNMAATEGLAKLVGEEGFGHLFHQGQNENIHISSVSERLLFVIIFDERSSLGLVRLRLKQAKSHIEAAIARAEKRSEDVAGSPLDEITDEDLDSLFGKD
jgi:predicted regulator of Ras-like GTPase activity (Roadblock/LC7/MglB family)